MEKERTRKFGDKRGMRNDSENEPARVYRPRTLGPRKKSSWGDEEQPSEKPESGSTHSDDLQSASNQNDDSFDSRDNRRDNRKSGETSDYRKRTLRDDRNRDEKDTQPRWRGSRSRGDEQPKGEDSFEKKPRFGQGDREGDRRDRPYGSENRRSYERKPRYSDERSGRSSGNRDDKPYERKPRYGDDDRKEHRKEYGNDRPRRSEGERTNDRRYSGNRSYSDKPYRSRERDHSERSDRRSSERDYKPRSGSIRKSDRDFDDKPVRFRKSFNEELGYQNNDRSKDDKYQPRSHSKDNTIPSKRSSFQDEKPMLEIDSDGTIRLNKFISNTGLCSRREADDFIQNGMITVNGEVIKQLGTKIKVTDEVCFKGKKLDIERKVYILLNKPKDYITTVDDPHAKRTVIELIEGACTERVYPVGRLDRNSTGLLLLTNDGELTTRLTHPSYKKKKIYHVVLDKPITNQDLEKLTQGIEDEGEMLVADVVDYVEGTDGSEIGVEIHTGQNRVVRRMLNSLGYNVTKLDRVYFAGLTKKNLPRGKWRFLTQKEVNMLQMNRFE